MKRYLKLLFLTIIISSCSSSEVDSIQSILLKQDTDNNATHLSDFVAEAEYIPLETKDECNIGRIEKVYFYNERIYVLDSYKARKMYVFSLDGIYIKTIGEQGKGPGAYRYPLDFSIIENEIYILSDYTRVQKYSIEGDFIEEYKLVFKAKRFHEIDNGFIFLYNTTDLSTHRIRFTDRMQTLNSFFEKEGKLYTHISFEDNFKSFSKNGDIKSVINLSLPREYIMDEPKLQTYYNFEPKNLRAKKFVEESLIIRNYLPLESVDFVTYKINGSDHIAFYSKTKHGVVSFQNLINDIDYCSVLPTLYSSLNSNTILAYYYSDKLFSDEVEFDKESKIKTLDSGKLNNPIIVLYRVKEF